MKPEHDDFEQRIRATLNNSVTHLDATTRNRLSANRRAAFAQPPRWALLTGWMPATALATVGVLTMTLLLNFSQQEIPQHLVQDDTDAPLEFLLTDDGDELSDPDFYVWLDEALLAQAGQSDAG